jgi:hypothetical protein
MIVNFYPAILPDPVYQWKVYEIRQAAKNILKDEDEEVGLRLTDEGAIKRQALWYSRLLEDCTEVGTVRYNGELLTTMLIHF